MYPKDTEKWKQFTTKSFIMFWIFPLFCIPKILKNESNSQQRRTGRRWNKCCFVSQRYWKMKAIHNTRHFQTNLLQVVLYPKDTEKWKQFTTNFSLCLWPLLLFCIPKILKNESNSQQLRLHLILGYRCFVSQRYWKMKAIHNKNYLII